MKLLIAFLICAFAAAQDISTEPTVAYGHGTIILLLASQADAVLASDGKVEDVGPGAPTGENETDQCKLFVLNNRTAAAVAGISYSVHPTAHEYDWTMKTVMNYIAKPVPVHGEDVDTTAQRWGNRLKQLFSLDPPDTLTAIAASSGGSLDTSVFVSINANRTITYAAERVTGEPDGAQLKFNTLKLPSGPVSQPNVTAIFIGGGGSKFLGSYLESPSERTLEDANLANSIHAPMDALTMDKMAIHLIQIAIKRSSGSLRGPIHLLHVRGAGGMRWQNGDTCSTLEPAR